jgi:DtxR family Mn-dependent transcriptional regulator
MEKAGTDLKNLNKASKEYLEAIYELEEEGQRIQQARVGERLGLAPATVSEGVKRLVTDGYIDIKGRVISLTKPGRKIAETLVRRHRLAERMLTDILGIPWHLCHEQAEDWEKVITPEVEKAIIARLGGQSTCPHGNPIPGMEPKVPWSKLRAVSALETGTRTRLVRLVEDVELHRDVLKYLEDRNLMPGSDLEVVERGPDGTVTLRVDQRSVALGPQLADNLWVLAE